MEIVNILITGSSGLIGTALCNSLTKSGNTIYVMDRRPHSESPFYWQPDKNIISFDESIRIDAVINLAGSNISDGRWTEAKKKIIFDSRIDSQLYYLTILVNYLLHLKYLSLHLLLVFMETQLTSRLMRTTLQAQTF